MAMNLVREQRTPLTIKSCDHRGFAVGGQLLTGAIALSWKGIVDSWPAPAPGALTAADLEPLISTGPDLILLGGGDDLRRSAPALMAGLQQKGIGCEVMGTAAACRTWNLLLAEGRQVAAALWPP